MKVLKLLFSTEGRMRRLYFWPIVIGAVIGLSIIQQLILPNEQLQEMGFYEEGENALVTGPLAIVLLIVMMALQVIQYACVFKRMQDRDFIWWFPLVPVIGSAVSLLVADIKFASIAVSLVVVVFGLIMIVVAFMSGTKGPNQYGPDPLANCYPNDIERQTAGNIEVKERKWLTPLVIVIVVAALSYQYFGQ